MDEQDLIDAALAVRQKAYCKYSNYHVGTALLDEHGDMHVGCNVENAAYPEGSCAEGNAIGAMVAAGGKSIRTIVIVGGRDDVEDCTPCGGCRQKIAEFADSDTKIILIRPGGHTREFNVDDLLPRSFHL